MCAVEAPHGWGPAAGAEREDVETDIVLAREWAYPFMQPMRRRWAEALNRRAAKEELLGSPLQPPGD